MLERKEYKLAIEYFKNNKNDEKPQVLDASAEYLSSSKKTERLNKLSWEVAKKVKENNALRQEYLDLRNTSEEF